MTPPAAAELAEGTKGVLRFIPRLVTILDTLGRITKTMDRHAERIEALELEVATLKAREAELLARTEATALRATADLSGRLGRFEGELAARRNQTPGG